MMTAHRLRNLFGAVTVAGAAVLAGVAPPLASAAPCPDVALAFARGTNEAPGVGGVGQAFVDSLRGQLGPRSLDVHAVNYAASGDFANRDAIARTVIDGVRDEENYIQTTITNCPNTRIVLGGYSQGAALTGYTTAQSVPPGVPADAVPPPLSPDVAQHVAAVVLIGTPSAQFLNQNGAPPLEIGPLFQDKTLKVCNPDDTICNGAADAPPSIAHALYPFNGSLNQAAGYAVARV